LAVVTSSFESTEFSVKREWQSDRRTPARWVISHIKRNWIHFIGIVLGALGNAGLGAAMPLLAGQAFNAINRSQPDYTTLLIASLLIVLSQLVRGVVQYWRNASAEVIGQRLERDARDELYVSLIGKSMSFHDRQRIGDIMARATNDVRELNLLCSPGLNIVLGSGSFLVFPIVLSPRLHETLFIVPLLFVVAYFISIVYFQRRLANATEVVRANFGKMNATLAEAIEGIETVKGAAQEKREIARFGETVRAWRDASIQQSDIEAVFLPSLLLGLTFTGGLFHALMLLNQGAIQVGDVVGFMGMLLFLQFPTFASQFAYPAIASGLSSAKRILQILNTETSLDQNREGYKETLRGQVEFENVSFGYFEGGMPAQDSQNLLAIQNVSLNIKTGQTVAIVGQTGSGKSTLTKVINRIYDPNEGSVKIDGVDTREWNLGALRRQISTIEQDVFLFSRTIADNIAYGAPNATREQIVEAARAAQAHEFITRFKDGYDTMVGERGVTLSGGQRQRIAIARAFLTDPRILILDDSTSAIDSATEDQIQRAIAQIAKGRTTFLITHRLSQIRWADVIVVMKRGRVSAVGSHDELMQKSKEYRAIFI
jgi:ATP-binding cassette subfamily B protein